jgi:hypothetical protein
MGCISMGSSSSYDKPAKGQAKSGPITVNVYPQITVAMPINNPNPLEYRVVRHKQVGRHLVIEIQYSNCTSYEGRKIMVYRNTKRSKLLEQKSIDPHFSNSKTMRSPFARFEPTATGWECAVALAQDICLEDNI